jgi:ATP-dependent exoDNAse (exonuclease V) beta subunit
MPIQFNQAQLKAIYSSDPKIVVVAPPGSGKTMVLCGAVQEYACLHPTHAITAITFTKKAATELAWKIGNPKVKTGTIHAWSWQQLDKLGTKYGFSVEVMEEEEMRRIMQKIAYQKNLKFVNIYQLYNYIVGNIKTLDLDDNIVKKYEKIKAHYIQYKMDNGLYDFTDLPQYLLNMLEEYDEEIYDIDAFFVDEFQDIDEIQFDIFNKVCARKKFYIGDFRQSIYGFNGALDDIFERLSAAEFKIYNLEINYRSKQSIMDVADSFRDSYNDEACRITDLRYLKHSNIECDRGPGGNVYFIDKDGYCLTAGEAEYEDPKYIVRYLLGMPDTMILCRSNKQVRKIQAFGFENCSTIHQAKGLEYNNVILADMLVDNIEELNVAYVGMTRAKNELCVINYEYLISILSSTPAEKPKPKQNLLF